MTQLSFAVLDVQAEPAAAVPQLVARLQIEESSGALVHAMVVRAQVCIEPLRRAAGEEQGLLSRYGPREPWRETERPLRWLQATTMVRGFTGVTETDLPLPCTYDFNVTASQYLHALGEGAVGLRMMFSGTVLTRGSHGFGVQPVSWDCEARHEMPVAVWQDLMAEHYPGTGWLRVGHDVIARLARHKADHGLISWDETLRSLLPAGEAPRTQARLRVGGAASGSG
ncbi:DUF6084 family protein [Rhodococcus sp. X156]|uniref:DUF6084 family protein n=1 Tax=Rhodococcus sp. X156 TaxID=2499145 RepID=UPI000FD93372|nr:DUF6084 family protein [Rhodococcus sp. X156]